MARKAGLLGSVYDTEAKPSIKEIDRRRFTSIFLASLTTLVNRLNPAILSIEPKA